jgi:hypothetical protein
MFNLQDGINLMIHDFSNLNSDMTNQIITRVNQLMKLSETSKKALDSHHYESDRNQY